MRHRIRAAGILVQDEKVLLVQHSENGKEYWVPPGGGLEQQDGPTQNAVKREFMEEANLNVEVGELLYIREFYENQRDVFHLELFYLITSWSGELSTHNLTGLGGDEHIIKSVQWIHRNQLSQITFYPEELKNHLWQMLDCNNLKTCHVGFHSSSDS